MIISAVIIAASHVSTIHCISRISYNVARSPEKVNSYDNLGKLGEALDLEDLDDGG
jgi:hypothetical protein